MKRITAATLFQNGLVAVFDETGEQVPELQGRFREVHEKILARADDLTDLIVMDYGAGLALTVDYWQWVDTGLLWDEEVSTSDPPPSDP